jgi:hypothetical protein
MTFRGTDLCQRETNQDPAPYFIGDWLTLQHADTSQHVINDAGTVLPMSNRKQLKGIDQPRGKLERQRVVEHAKEVPGWAFANENPATTARAELKQRKNILCREILIFHFLFFVFVRIKTKRQGGILQASLTHARLCQRQARGNPSPETIRHRLTDMKLEMSCRIGKAMTDGRTEAEAQNQPQNELT